MTVNINDNTKVDVSLIKSIMEDAQNDFDIKLASRGRDYNMSKLALDDLLEDDTDDAQLYDLTRRTLSDANSYIVVLERKLKALEDHLSGVVDGSAQKNADIMLQIMFGK